MKHIISALIAASQLAGVPGMPEIFPKLTERERMVNGMSLIELMAEYNLIVDKKSTHCRAVRDHIQARVKYLIKIGRLTTLEDGKVTVFIRVNPE